MKKKTSGTKESTEGMLLKMVGVVSHELRNPLAIMSNSLYFIKLKLTGAPGTDPKLNKHIGIIESEIKNANAVVGELVGFFREAALELKQTSLDRVVEDALAAWSPPANVKISKEMDGAGIDLEADPARISDAVKRVLANAAEAMPQGGEVKVRVARKGKQPVIEVADAGPGIKPDDLQRVFDPFFSTKPRGLGLGLAVAKRALEAHGGTIEVKTQPGKGTTVRLLLPA